MVVTRFVKSLLFGIGPSYEAVLLGATTLLMSVAVGVSWLPFSSPRFCNRHPCSPRVVASSSPRTSARRRLILPIEACVPVENHVDRGRSDFPFDEEPLTVRSHIVKVAADPRARQFGGAKQHPTG
jgi:hypothetical protein